MSRLTERQQTNITVEGQEYPLDIGFRAALLTWDALEAAYTGDLSPLAASFVAVNEMLGVDCEQMTMPWINEAVKEIAAYLHKYSRISEKETNSPGEKPLYDLEQDAVMIRDSLRLLNVDLDVDDISYPRFMSLMRLISTTESPYCRVVYLRGQHRKGKLTPEEKKECARIGWDVIKIRDKKKEKEAADNSEYFKELKNKKRAEMGLPPV